MSAGHFTWFVALLGALWTWLLASWSGVSLATSLLRAITVFVLMAAVMVVFQMVFLPLKGTQKMAEKRPASEQPSAQEASEEQQAA
jgi:NADH:ubiquinone oxidoreductase subunit 6 (subunit J)